jgi:hypothetical protein
MWFYREQSLLKNTIPLFLHASDKKPIARLLSELLQSALKYRCLPDHYFTYRLYRKELSTEKVLNYVPGYVLSQRWFPIVNKHFKQHQLLLNNKILFKRFLMSAGIPVPEPIIYIIDRTCFTPDMHIISFDEGAEVLTNCGIRRIFCKSDIAEAATGITCFNYDHTQGTYHAGPVLLDRCYLENLPVRDGYLFEHGVVQHPDMAIFHPESLNTFRVVTQFVPGIGAHVLYVTVRFGTGGSVFDNGCKGGVFAGVNAATGALFPQAFDKISDVYETHPTTNIPFGGTTFAFIREITSIACRAAELLPTLPSIGWDIAYTEQGPIIVEGNDRWGAPLYQFPFGGLNDLLQNEWFAHREHTKRND